MKFLIYLSLDILRTVFFLWTCVQSFAALLCISLPVIYPILPTSTLWSRLTTIMNSYASFGRFSRSRKTSNSNQDLRNTNGLEPGRKKDNSWKLLSEDNSTRHLAWPESTYGADSYALSDFQREGVHPKSPGIVVERQFDVG
jgi:hypothetical protein